MHVCTHAQACAHSHKLERMCAFVHAIARKHVCAGVRMHTRAWIDGCGGLKGRDFGRLNLRPLRNLFCVRSSGLFFPIGKLSSDLSGWRMRSTSSIIKMPSRNRSKMSVAVAAWSRYIAMFAALPRFDIWSTMCTPSINFRRNALTQAGVDTIRAPVFFVSTSFSYIDEWIEWNLSTIGYIAYSPKPPLVMAQSMATAYSPNAPYGSIAYTRGEALWPRATALRTMAMVVWPWPYAL